MTTRAVYFDRLISIPIERIAATGDVDRFGNPAPETVRSGMVWARREDFNARDALQATAGGLVNIRDRRYTIRAENARAVQIGDGMTDENSYPRPGGSIPLRVYSDWQARENVHGSTG